MEKAIEKEAGTVDVAKIEEDVRKIVAEGVSEGNSPSTMKKKSMLRVIALPPASSSAAPY